MHIYIYIYIYIYINEIGRISKSILDKTNIFSFEKLKLNEWKNTTDVINWFKIDVTMGAYNDVEICELVGNI